MMTRLMRVTRRRDAAATRQELLEAANRRFTELGYKATTLRDVAADVGVNLALIKRYFGSKEGLLKAALAGEPRFGDEAMPWNRAALAAALSRQLTTETWPQFDEHPVLMLLRVSGDPQVDGLRRQALLDLSDRVLAATGSDDTGDHLLHAQLIVALGIGVATVRSTVGLQPLRDADAERLAEPLRAIIDALFPTGRA